MDTQEAITTRRSVRAFLDEEITDEAIDSLLRAATAGPSGGNGQPWSFVVVKNAMRKRAIQSLSPGMGSVPPLIIALCLDTTRATASMPSVLSHLDIGASMQNILLAAYNQGLGAYAIASFQKNAVSTTLRLPESQELMLLIAVGKPLKMPSPPKKRSWNDMIWSEKYGTVYGE